MGKKGSETWLRLTPSDARQLSCFPGSERVSRWAGQDSNLRPTDYESAALTTELPAPERNLALPPPAMVDGRSARFLLYLILRRERVT